MPQILGTQVAVEFVSFPGRYPDLYYAAGEGVHNLASVNAGNSDGLCVGLAGVNGGFKHDLTVAGQKRVDLGGAPNDDYQDRHQRLLAKALADPSRSATESYSAIDPSLFSYVYAAPVTQKSGWHDGVCFVDIFDPSLRPSGNAKNAGMLYVAPPYDGNYADQTAFLQAIETTAHNIVRTVAGYNAVAAAQKLPPIEALRLTLFSSNIYNQKYSVPAADIAHAIWRGLLAGIHAFPASGLLELQLPAGSGSQEVLFGVLQGDPALAAAAHPHVHLREGLGGKGVAVAEFEVFEGERAVSEDFDEFHEAPEVADDDAGEEALQASSAEVQQLVAGVRAAGQRWTQALQAGQVNGGGLAAVAPGPNGNYQYLAGVQLAGDYDGVGAPMGGPMGDAYNAARDFMTAVATIPNGKSAEVRQAIRKAANTLRDLNATVARAEAAPPALDPAARDADEQQLALLKQIRRDVAKTGMEYVKVARQRYTARRALEVKPIKIGLGIVGALAGVATLVGTLVWHFTKGDSASTKAADLSQAFGPRRATDMAAPTLKFEVIEFNQLTGMVNSVTLSGQTGGTWAVNQDNSVQFTAPADPAATASATYTLALTNGTSMTGTLTANFVSDLVAAAPDRTTAVTVQARSGFAFLAKPLPSGWSVDTKQVVTFTPGASFTAPYARQAFTDSLGGSITLALVILFPAQPLTANPANRVAVTLDAIPNFSANDEVSVVLLNGTVEATELTVPGGKWTAINGGITFTPDAQLPAAATAVSVQYALKYGKTLAAAAAATISYPATGGVAALDETVYVLSRTKPVVIALAGATLGTAPAGTPGAWSSDAVSVTFTPANVPATGVVTVQSPFTVNSQAGTVKVVFVAPADRPLASVSRIGGKVSLPLPAGEVLPASSRVWLLDQTGGRTASVGATGGNGHGWTISTNGQVIEFTPNVTFFTDDSQSVSFVYSDGTDESPKATAKVDFSKDTVAWPIAYSGPATASHDEDVINHCYVAPGQRITSVTLTNNEPTRIKLNSPGSKPTVVTFDPGGMGARVDRASYQVTDSANGKSNVAPITVTFTAAMSRRAMPMAANCLVAKSAAPDQSRVAKVLDGATAYWGVNANTVKLAGPADLGDGNTVDRAGLAADGKSMYVPNQGSWFVDDSGAIVFHADSNFSGPPTPATFTFADQKGNVSSPSVVVFDDTLASVTSAPKAVAALDETAFWNDYRIHVALVHPRLTAHAILSVTHSLAWAAGLAAKPGPDPVDLDAYDTAYQAWIDGGQAWSDPPGAKSPVGLISICEQLVTNALPAGSAELLTRYWRLQYMAHMVAQSLPDGGAQ